MDDIKPDRLTCEYSVNPLGIDVPAPRLSWTLTSSLRNQFQSAYELIVSDNVKDIEQLQGNVWQSGKVSSSENIHIQYKGLPLRSFTRYYWRVRVYNQDGVVSPWSNTAWFETSLLQPSDWQAKWIGDGSRQFEKDEDFYKDDPMPLLRRQFSLEKKILSARLYISGLGYYEAYLNGKKIGDNVLDPGWTTHKKQALYTVYDITSHLKRGKNVAGIMLGNGWWNPLPIKLFGRFNLRDVQQTGKPCVKAEFHITYSDGTKEKIITDETWQTAAGPVTRNNVYLGEHYDARLEIKNWNTTTAVSGSVWKNAAIVQGPSGTLNTQMQPPVKVTRVLKPVRITEPQPGVFIADMGQNFAGAARIQVNGKRGTTIRLRYGEDLHPDGTLNFLTTVAGQIKEMWNLKGGPGAPPTAWQEDRYTLNGTGVETWSPRFTFHGFRYVEVTGWPGKLSVNDIEGLRMNADLEEAGTFACSNEMFNRLHEVVKWTFMSNVFSVQSDCPGREKMGYGGDLVTTAESFLYNYNMGNFYWKTVQDFANEQQPDGAITEIAPYTGIADKGYGGESGPLGWQLAFPFLQKQLYDFYGDVKIIEDFYDEFQKQIEFLESHAKWNLYYWDISDHASIDTKPEALTASAFYYHHVHLASTFAGILDKAEDSVRYDKLAQRIKAAIVREFHVPNTGRFDNATQAAQIFALWYELSPEREKTFQELLREFDRHRGHVSTGIFATKMMFDIFRTANSNDVVYAIANQKDYPGWGYMLARGATTLWESWEYPDNAPSQNHPMFGSVDEWFYRSLLGINAGSPGFKKIIIKPQPAGDLTWAKGSYQSVRGEIKSDWKIESNSFILACSIPPNTRAEVWLRCKEGGAVIESGNQLPVKKYSEGYAIVEVGCGIYSFQCVF